MADNKKYYYLKLKEDFFDSDEMLLLQGMKDGYLYSDILMKMYLRSLNHFDVWLLFLRSGRNVEWQSLSSILVRNFLVYCTLDIVAPVPHKI